MAGDPLQRLAHLRIIKISADLEVALSTKQGGNIAIELLHRLQNKAASSLQALAVCDTEDPRELRLLQNEVKRYDEWLADMRAIIAEGKQYDQQISEEDRNEMLDLLTQSPEGQRTAVALGLIDEKPQDA